MNDDDSENDGIIAITEWLRDKKSNIIRSGYTM